MARQRLTDEQMTKAMDAIEFLSSLKGDNPRSGSSSTSSTRVSAGSSSSSSSRYLSDTGKNLIREADKVLEELKMAGLGRKRKAKEEVKFLFSSSGKTKKGKGKAIPWKHRFVCLPYYDQEKIPTTDIEKDDLLKCGLGEKLIEFDSIDLSADEFKDVLLEAFPKLSDGGGYMFFKCTPNTRNLEPLSESVMSSPKVLKERVNTSRTYIKPLQCDLDMSQVYELPKGPEEACLKCGLKVTSGELATHLKKCGNENELSDSEDSDQDSVDLPAVNFSPVVDLTCENEVPISTPCADVAVMKQEMVDTAIERSMSEITQLETLSSTGKPITTPLQMAVATFANRLSSKHNLILEIRRDSVLADAMKESGKKKFDPNLKLKVSVMTMTFSLLGRA